MSPRFYDPMADILQRSMAPREGVVTMKGATLYISSKNYSSWSLRGFLLARLSGLVFEERVVSPDDPTNRAELLLQSSSIRIPYLVHGDVVIWRKDGKTDWGSSPTVHGLPFALQTLGASFAWGIEQATDAAAGRDLDHDRARHDQRPWTVQAKPSSRRAAA